MLPLPPRREIARFAPSADRSVGAIRDRRR